MNKTYIKPTTKVIDISAESLLAASISLDNENKVDTSDPNNQLGREDGNIGVSPNVWEQGW
ncbi:MAG: hypothetical protein K2J00_01225 [Bacteroidaceae bacterium]|nr:hypothetical protein [Bacteroidaceae bacterium]